MVGALIATVLVATCCSDPGWFLIVIQAIWFGMVAASLATSLTDSIPLAKASALFPSKPHVNVIRRWCYHGVRGVVLSSHLIAGRRYLTREGIAEFIRELNAPKVGGSAASTNSANDATNERRAKDEKSAALASL